MPASLGASEREPNHVAARPLSPPREDAEERSERYEQRKRPRVERVQVRLQPADTRRDELERRRRGGESFDPRGVVPALEEVTPGAVALVGVHRRLTPVLPVLLGVRKRHHYPPARLRHPRQLAERLLVAR